MPQPRRHIYQFATNAACARYRLEIPARHLNRSGRSLVKRFRRMSRPLLAEIIEQADMLILQRLPMSPGVHRLIKMMNNLGRPVIFEIDDDLFSLPEDSYYLRRAPADYKSRLGQTMLACQAVQCSTTALAAQLQLRVKEVSVLENQLDDIREFTDKCERGQPLIIGYAAGENHTRDWQVIGATLNRCLQAMAGRGIDFEVRIIGDRAIFDGIETQHKRFLPLLRYGDYLAALRSFHISLMPLVDMQFNRCKSDVKFLESAASGCAVIASDIVYGQTIEHEKTGLLFKTPSQFERHLLSLAQHPENIRRLARRAHAYVAHNRLMHQHIHKWESVYSDWYARRHALIQNSKTS